MQFKSPVLFLKVFQVTDYKTVTNKVSLNFHFLLPRVTSLKIYQRIPLKNLRALSLSLRSQLLVLLLSNRFLLKVNCLDPFSIGNLLVRRILYYLSSEMATKSLLFPRRRRKFPFRKRSMPFSRHLEIFLTVNEFFSTKLKKKENL